MIYTRKFCMTLLLLMGCNGYGTSSSTQFKLLRGNANNCTSEDLQKEEDLEYPGRDRRILKILHDLWQKYYACLREKENQEKKPEIRRLLEGQCTEFICDICPRPFQDFEQLEWKFKPLSPDTDIKDLEYLDVTPEMILTTNKTLRIFNAVENLAGLYACYHKKNVVSVYVLEVSRNDTTEKVETLQSHNKHFIKLEEKNFQIYYQWTPWTECNTCGKVGKKFKYGTCFISLKAASAFNAKKLYKAQNLVSSRSVENSVKPDEHLKQNSLKKLKLGSLFRDDNSTSEAGINQNWRLETIEKFSTGIPCASQYLPKAAFEFVKIYKAVKVLVKYCMEPCKETEIFEVVDNLGKVVEVANNSAGIYSIFQKLPQLPPNIERRSLTVEFGDDLIIQCPGTSLSNTPAIWKINGKIIFPEIVANESNGRFTIDLVNRIHIKKLRLADGKIYSCWQKDRLVGTIHLNVEKKFKIGFNHHVTLIGIIAVIGVFLMMGSKILARELQLRKK